MLKKNLIIVSSLLCFFLFGNNVNAQTFSDVYSTHPYYNAIESLAEQGILNGYPDKTFKADNAINRAEILKVLLLGSKIDVEDTTYNAGFPDVISNSWYAKYIVKAKDKGIIKGHPDGYFHPDNQVNYAEALKMLALINNVELKTNLTSNPFIDVNKDDWFAPYFEYAKSVSIIKNQSDEYVTPAKPLDRGEVAQLIFLFQETQKINKEKQVATYYADYFHGRTTASGEIFDQNKLTAAHKTLSFGTQVKVTNLENNESVIVTINDRGPYASNPNYVIDLSKTAFQSISPLSRGIIEIEYEILNSETSAVVTEDETTDCETQYPKKIITKDFFEGVTLDQEIPNLFQKNEVYTISGEVKDSEDDSVIVFLVNSEDSSEEYKYFGELEEGRFTIPVNLNKTGIFQLGILKGLSGKSFVHEINVTKDECISKMELEQSISPTTLGVQYKDEKTTILWENHGQQLSKLEIRQGNNKNTYILNNYQESLTLPYKDFVNFSQGEVFYKISGASSESIFSLDQSSQWSSSDEKSFFAVQHHIVSNKPYLFEVKNLPTTYTVNENIVISGNSKKTLMPNATLITPSRLIEESPLSIVKSGTSSIDESNINDSYIFNYTPKLGGTYIIEINAQDGFYIINMPIYEKGSIPLIPDGWDLNDSPFNDTVELIEIENLKNNLLKDINLSRKEHGSDEIKLSIVLSQLAQYRAEDMVNNNYLSHTNLQGQGVNDIKINFGINKNVSENFLRFKPELVHDGLMRSPIHRKSILNPQWNEIGLGFAIDDNGDIVVVEEFIQNNSIENNVPNLRSQILETVNYKRSEKILSDNTLDNVAQEWSENIVNRPDIWFEDPDTALSLTYLVDNVTNFEKQNVSSIIKGDFDPILEEIDKNETILDDKWKRLGTGITQNDDGSLNVTIIYSD